MSKTALSVARGNGKSTLVAAIAVQALLGALQARRADVICVASSFQQARIVFDHILAFLGEAAGDRDTYQVADTNNKAQIK